MDGASGCVSIAPRRRQPVKEKASGRRRGGAGERFRKVVEKIALVSTLTGRAGTLRGHLPQAKESSHVNPCRFGPFAGPARG
jgi:hypothetical protein